MSDNGTSSIALACQILGAVAGIGGMFLLCGGIALDYRPVALASIAGIILGPLFFMLGRILRKWS